MLRARVLKGPVGEEKQFFVLRWFEAMFEGWRRAYQWSLDWVLRYRSFMLMMTFATIAGTAWLYVVVPKGFFPAEDAGFLFGIIEAKTDIAFDSMTKLQRKIATIYTPAN
ncbi:MAG: efflux RND transporter permease subunit, partial [Pseudolabrys sp.]